MEGGAAISSPATIEDIVAIVDGRPSLVAEIDASSAELREHISSGIGRLLDAGLSDAIAGHLPGDLTSQQREPTVRERLETIAGRLHRPA